LATPSNPACEKLTSLEPHGFIACFCSARVFCAAEDVKKIHPSGYVSDLTGVIAPEARTRLEALCADVEQKTGAQQMAIVTVQSLDGESVENYAVDLYKQLGVGSKKDNRGVVLLVAPHERKYRIEVGYGLEPVINDARAGDAGRAMVPFLRQGDYGKAARGRRVAVSKVHCGRCWGYLEWPAARGTNSKTPELAAGIWGFGSCSV